MVMGSLKRERNAIAGQRRYILYIGSLLLTYIKPPGVRD